LIALSQPMAVASSTTSVIGCGPSPGQPPSSSHVAGSIFLCTIYFEVLLGYQCTYVCYVFIKNQSINQAINMIILASAVAVLSCCTIIMHKPCELRSIYALQPVAASSRVHSIPPSERCGLALTMFDVGRVDIFHIRIVGSGRTVRSKVRDEYHHNLIAL